MTPAGAHLGDPDFEPTDDQLAALSREAFALVPDRNRQALARLREQIAELRRATLARLAQMTPLASDSR